MEVQAVFAIALGISLIKCMAIRATESTTASLTSPFKSLRYILNLLGRII